MSLYKLRSSIIAAAVLTMAPFYIVFGASGTIDGNAVRLRKEPSSSAKIITLLEKGKSVEIIKEENGWVNIKTGSMSGWVSVDLLKKEEVLETAVEGVSSEEQANLEEQNVVIDADVVNIRKEPTTESSIVAKAQKGQMIKVLSTSEDGEWSKIAFGEIEGFVRNDLISTDLSLVKGEGIISGSVVHLRETSSAESESLAKLTKGTKVSVIGAENEWYKVNYEDKTGFIHSDYVTIGDINPTSRAGTSKVQKVIDAAKKQLGKRYVWAGNGPNSFDCSGLMKYIFGQVGITLNRTSSEQAQQGIAVSKSKLSPGDMVFFSGINSSSKSKSVSHVGIYIGNGEFIHAANPSRGVVKDSLSTDYYAKKYVTARRMIR